MAFNRSECAQDASEELLRFRVFGSNAESAGLIFRVFSGF